MPGFPGDKCLAVTTIDPQAGAGEVVAEDVFLRALFAYNDPTGARHREVRTMRKTMDFDDVCEHRGTW